MVRELLPVIVLALGLAVCAEARAADPVTACKEKPEDPRCRFLLCRIKRDEATATVTTLERELAKVRQREALLEQSMETLQARVDQGEKRVRNQRAAGVVVGALGTAALVGGTAWALGQAGR